MIVLAQAGPELARGSSLASWRPLIGMMVFFAMLVVGMTAFGPRADHPSRIARLVLRGPLAFQRLTGIPAWAAASAGFAMWGLLVAGQGFYSDVAWHIALGRDDVLFTAPHASIVVGLGMIAFGALYGIVVATLTKVDKGMRVGAVHVPWSLVPLSVLGVAGLIGFPIDDLWHRAFGVDVTMWSPPHMIMILSASFTGMAAWMILGEAGVPVGGKGLRLRDRAWGRAAHVSAAVLTILGVSAPMGEFSFGVPQFQQLYHPVLVAMASGLALIAMRIVLGRFWTFGILGLFFLISGNASASGGSGPADNRSTAVFLVSALVVELAATLLGTDKRLRFALVAGAGIGTIGMAGEWAWNQGAYQPWTTALLPEAAILGVAAALAAAVVGAAFGGAVSRQPGGTRIPAVALGLAGLVILTSLALPAPRQVGDVRADVTIEQVQDDQAIIHARLYPPDAAEDARWFMAASWQGGGHTLAHMQPVGGGRYVSEGPIELGGRYKTLLRLHRGAEMMSIPIRLPADPAYGLEEIPAQDRTRVAFGDEKQYLLREAGPAVGWFAVLVYALWAGLSILWVASFTLAGAKIQQPGERVSIPGARPKVRA